MDKKLVQHLGWVCAQCDQVGPFVCHHDSGGSFGLERVWPAPSVSGGNDNGSGIISILNITRRIKQTGINVELVGFVGADECMTYTRELKIVLIPACLVSALPMSHNLQQSPGVSRIQSVAD